MCSSLPHSISLYPFISLLAPDEARTEAAPHEALTDQTQPGCVFFAPSCCFLIKAHVSPFSCRSGRQMFQSDSQTSWPSWTLLWRGMFFFSSLSLFTLQENIAVQTITLVTHFDLNKLFQSHPGYFSLHSVKCCVRMVRLDRTGSVFRVRVKGLSCLFSVLRNLTQQCDARRPRLKLTISSLVTHQRLFPQSYLKLMICSSSAVTRFYL